MEDKLVTNDQRVTEDNQVKVNRNPQPANPAEHDLLGYWFAGLTLGMLLMAMAGGLITLTMYDIAFTSF